MTAFLPKQKRHKSFTVRVDDAVDEEVRALCKKMGYIKLAHLLNDIFDDGLETARKKARSMGHRGS